MDFLCFFCLVFARPLCTSVYMCLISAVCLLCFCVRLFIVALCSPAGKGIPPDSRL